MCLSTRPTRSAPTTTRPTSMLIIIFSKPREEVPLTQVDLWAWIFCHGESSAAPPSSEGLRVAQWSDWSHSRGSIEEVIRPQYGGTRGWWRRRGRGQSLDESDMIFKLSFFKLSSCLYSFGKLGSTPIFFLFVSLSLFFCNLTVPVNDNSLSFTDSLPPQIVQSNRKPDQ